MKAIPTDALERIHLASLGILERTGMVFHDGEILARLEDHGFRVKKDKVLFRPEQVMEWVGRAPKRFVLYAPTGDRSVEIGGESTVYAPAYGCPMVIEADGHRRSASFRDYLELVRLVHQSPRLGVNGGILVEPGDVDLKYRRLLMAYAAMVLSDKPILGTPGTGEQVGGIMGLAAAARGKERFSGFPAVMTLVNTLSPLRLDAIAAATIRTCAQYRQPVIVTPGPMAGATGPITLAGNIALAHAEALATIVACQVLQPGMPVVYGPVPTITDMRTGRVSIGCPGFAVQTAWCAGLARHLGLPSRGGGACTDALRVSVQSGCESMLSLMTSRMNGMNLVLHAAGILGSFAAFSFEQFIIDGEMIRMVEACSSDLDLNDEALALDVVESVGAGGEYLTTKHTLRNCRGASWLPDLSIPAGDPKDFHGRYMEKVSSRRVSLLKEYRPPEIPAGLRNELECFATARGVPRELLAAVAAGDGRGNA